MYLQGEGLTWTTKITRCISWSYKEEATKIRTTSWNAQNTRYIQANLAETNQTDKPDNNGRRERENAQIHTKMGVPREKTDAEEALSTEDTH